MNIELRWLQRKLYDSMGVQIGEECVLQYRERKYEGGMEVIGIPGVWLNEWSDWRDVPVVKEEG